jgi:signal transduction histidine kinase
MSSEAQLSLDRAGADLSRLGGASGSLQLDPTLSADSLKPFYRWGWIPLVAGCALIVLVVIVASELALERLGMAPQDARVRWVFISRAVVTSTLLALWAGWYVLRSRSRIEQVRDQLRIQQIALAEQAWRLEQMVGLGALTRVLAHEIRGPLHSISLQMAVLRKSLANLPGPQRLSGVSAQVESEVERLDGLLEDYMEYTHVPTGALLAQPVELLELVEGVMATHRAGFERKGVHLDSSMPPTLPRVSADPGRLRQLVLLLVRNAQESVSAGGTVRIGARTEGADVHFQISYDGAHLEHPEDVFRPFFTARRGSSGLTLAIVRDIVRAHGGEVSARGLPTGGLEITVRLAGEHP